LSWEEPQAFNWTWVKMHDTKPHSWAPLRVWCGWKSGHLFLSGGRRREKSGKTLYFSSIVTRQTIWELLKFRSLPKPLPVACKVNTLGAIHRPILGLEMFEKSGDKQSGKFHNSSNFYLSLNPPNTPPAFLKLTLKLSHIYLGHIISQSPTCTALEWRRSSQLLLSQHKSVPEELCYPFITESKKSCQRAI